MNRIVHRGRGSLLLLLPLLAAAPPAARAQVTLERVLEDWGRYRRNVLAFVDAMPEEHLDFRPTSGVRSFAEQIEHIVRTNLDLVATGVLEMDTPPTMGGRGAYLRSRRELRDFVGRTFDFVEESLRALPGGLTGSGRIFDRTMPKWRILGLAREHGVWTLGQLVPYLRLNGVEPPEYVLLPGGGGG